MSRVQEEKKKPIVLLIDDEDDYRISFREAYDEDFELIEALSYEVAIDIVAKNRGINLIVLDLELKENSGEYDGYKLIPAIQKVTATPIIVITGKYNSDVIEIINKVTKDGIFGVLSKGKYDINIWRNKFVAGIEKGQNDHSAYALILNYISKKNHLKEAFSLLKLVLTEKGRDVNIDIELSALLGRIEKLNDSEGTNDSERGQIIQSLISIINESKREEILRNYYPLLS